MSQPPRKFPPWAFYLLAWTLIGLIYFVDDRARTVALEAWFGMAAGCVFFWFVFGPLWVLVFSMRSPKQNA